MVDFQYFPEYELKEKHTISLKIITSENNNSKQINMPDFYFWWQRLHK